MISFANSDYILLISGAVLLLGLLWGGYAWWRRYALRHAFSDEMIDRALGRRGRLVLLLRDVLILTALIVFGVTLLRPQWGEHGRQVHDEGTDLLIVLDVSRSMMAADVAPSRLDRARDALRLLAEKLEGDRIGLVLFAGSSFMQCPLTSDRGAFEMFLQAAGPDAIRSQGTDIGGALELAGRIFEKRNMTTRVVLLVTDGEDFEGRIDDALDDLTRKDVKVYAASVGYGSGAPVPLNVNAPGEYVRDYKGGNVVSKANAGILKDIAGKTGGRYFDLNSGFSGIVRMKADLGLERRSSNGIRFVTEKIERYQLFAVLTLLLLFLEMVLLDWRRR